MGSRGRVEVRCSAEQRSGRDTLSQPGQTSLLHHQHRSGQLLSCMQRLQPGQSTSCQLINFFSGSTTQTQHFPESIPDWVTQCEVSFYVNFKLKGAVQYF